MYVRAYAIGFNGQRAEQLGELGYLAGDTRQLAIHRTSENTAAEGILDEDIAET